MQSLISSQDDYVIISVVVDICSKSNGQQARRFQIKVIIRQRRNQINNFLQHFRQFSHQENNLREKKTQESL